MDRRRFLSQRAAGGALLLAGAATAVAQTPKAEPKAEPKKAAPKREKKMPIPPETVQAFVRAAHKDFETVKKMLAETPGLLNATWDWGGGDFESALGAAAHTGGKEIARHLLEKGARPDIFVAAMLGKLDVVKAFVAALPGVERSPGPHGIPLLVHAKMGGDEAKAVAEYLEGLGPKKG